MAKPKRSKFSKGHKKLAEKKCPHKMSQEYLEDIATLYWNYWNGRPFCNFAIFHPIDDYDDESAAITYGHDLNFVIINKAHTKAIVNPEDHIHPVLYEVPPRDGRKTIEVALSGKGTEEDTYAIYKAMMDAEGDNPTPPPTVKKILNTGCVFVLGAPNFIQKAADQLGIKDLYTDIDDNGDLVISWDECPHFLLVGGDLKTLTANPKNHPAWSTSIPEEVSVAGDGATFTDLSGHDTEEDTQRIKLAMISIDGDLKNRLLSEAVSKLGQNNYDRMFETFLDEGPEGLRKALRDK